MLRVAAGRWRAWPRPRRSVGCGPARTRSRGASPRGPWVRAWAGAAWRRCCGPVCSATSFSRTLPPGPRWRCGRWCCTAMTVGWPRRRCTPPRRCGCAGRATGSWSRSPPCPDRSRYRGRPRRAWRPNSSRRARTSRSSTMRRGGRTVVSGLLVAGLVGWLLLMARPARAQTPPPPIGPGRPPCAAGPGGLLGCIPNPGDVLSGAARAVGGGAMKAVTTFFTGGAKWFVEQVQSFLKAADRPDLSTGWWVQKYDLMLALAWVVAAATLLLALVDAAAKGSWQGLGRAVLVDVPVAGVVGGFGPLVIQYLVDLADWLSSRLLQELGADAGRALGSSAQWFASFGAASGNPNVPLLAGFVAALVTIFAAFLVFLELLLRANAIYLIAALVPVVYAVRIWPAASGVARKTTEVLVAVVIAQPVVALAIAMGAAASASLDGVGSASLKQFGTAVAGAVFLLLAALAPWGMLSLMPAAEAAMAAHRQRAAIGGGARTVVTTAYTGTYLGRLAQAGATRAGGGRAETAAVAGAWGAPPPAAVETGKVVAAAQEQLGATAAGSGASSASPPPGSEPGAPGRPGRDGSASRGEPGPPSATGPPGSTGPPGPGAGKGP